MKTPAEVIAEIQRLWDRGHLLEPPADLIFPRRVALPPPSSNMMRDQYADVMAWYKDLEDHEATVKRSGYRILWREAALRDFGRSRVPDGVIVETIDDAVALIGRTSDAARYRNLVALTETNCPALLPWMRAHPLVPLECEWAELTTVVQWFISNPNAGIYRRQIDLPGIDTKFIETRRPLLASLLDAALPTSAIHPQYPPRNFDQRYGLRPKPVRIGVRSLDPALFRFGEIADVLAAVNDLAIISLPVRTIFIVENEITGLAFPFVPGALLIHGLGYGVDVIADIPWVHDRPVWYWGDIDTHGYSILSRLRGSLPHVQSFLMDEATLLQHRSQCVEEHPQNLGQHRFLTPSEEAMIQHLRMGTFGPHLRLEQERISIGWAISAIEQL